MEDTVKYTKVIKLISNFVVNIFYALFGDESKILEKQFKAANDWVDSQIEILERNEVFE